MRLLLLAAVCCGTVLSLPAARVYALETALHYYSEPGYFTYPQEGTVTPAGGYNFEVTTATPNRVQFHITHDNGYFIETFVARFAAPAGAVLTAGDYPEAANDFSDRATAPALFFEANYEGDNALGQFQILEIKFGANGKLKRFAANFVEHPSLFSSTAPFYGQIRYRSDVPYQAREGVAQTEKNHYNVLNTAERMSLKVARRDGSTGPLTVSYATADGTDVAGRDYAAVSGTLAWADGDTANKIITVPILHPASPPAAGNRFYINLSGPGASPQRRAAVTIFNDDSATSSAHFISDRGDYIGQGRERYFSIANWFVFGASRIPNSGGVRITFKNSGFYTGLDSDWSLDLYPPKGTPLVVGDYQNARSDAFEPGHPGLDLSGESRGSNDVTGSFRVLEAVYDAEGNVLQFAADFVQHSERGIPALTGQVRYHSTVPLPAPRPTTVKISALAPFTVDNLDYPIEVTLTRTGAVADRLVVRYEMSGTAVNGQDYRWLKGTKTIKAGDDSAVVRLRPINIDLGNALIIQRKVIATMKLLPQDEYGIVGSDSVDIEIDQD